MRSHARALIAVVLAVGLLALFLYNVDLRGVAIAIVRADPLWLLLAFVSVLANLAVRAIRWRYLLEPLGNASFVNSFRATVVGFGARSILPSFASEFIRPYFLSRYEAISATGAFATLVLERALDVLMILVLLASFLFVFGDFSGSGSQSITLVKASGGLFAAVAVAGLVIMFVVAGHPERVKAALARIERGIPSRFAGLLGKIADKFLTGLGAVRRPSQLLVAVVWSVPLWMLIGFGMWAVARAFELPVPYTGSFLIVAFLTLGIMVPTPGAVGGFHEAFRFSVTQFFGANDTAAVGAAIAAHVLSMAPSFFLGLAFAAQAGMNFSSMRQLVNQADAEPGHIAR